MMSNENAGAVGVLGAHIVKRCRKLFTCRQIEDRRRLVEQQQVGLGSAHSSSTR